MLEKESTEEGKEGGGGQRKADSEGAPSSMGPTEIPRGPYWLLVADHGGAHSSALGSAASNVRDGYGGGIQGSVLLMEMGAEKTLPIFFSEEKADLFLISLVSVGGYGGEDVYRKRRTWAAELLSVLTASPYSSGPCAGVEKVALDPSREEADGSKDGPRCIDRRCFQEHLMGRGAGWFRDAGGGA